MNRFGFLIALTKRVSEMTGNVSGWFVFLMIVLVLFEVFMRYVMNRPPMIADEFGGYLLVAVSYLGAAYTFKENGHVRITILIDHLPTRLVMWLRLVTLTMGFFFAVIMSKVSYTYLVFSVKVNIRSPTWIHFPLKWVQVTLIVGFIILALSLLASIAETVFEIKSVNSMVDPAQVQKDHQ